MWYKSSIVALLFLVSGCISSSEIQGQYVAQQDDCRSAIADTLARADASVGDNSAASAAAGAQFSHCMNKAGWHVATPKVSQVASGPAPNPPSGSPSTNPHAALSAAPAPQPAAVAPVRQVPVAPAKPTINAPSAPLPASAPAPATYQPARPVSVTGPTSYGQGGGRQF